MPPPPLLGYNNNVRHRGRIFHIQTEDSGIQSPRIKTHLFADGGRIVRSTKTDYSEHVGQPDMAEKVKNLMKEQHKAMFVALRSGQLDATIGFADDAGEVAADGSVTLESSPESLRDGMQVARAPASSSVVKSVPLAPSGVVASPDAQQAGAIAHAAGSSAVGPGAASPGAANPGAANPGSEPAPRPPSDAPDRPYAAPRPAAIFSAPPTTSIFGDVGIDEKSLDDAILSYLAEDPKKPA